MLRKCPNRLHESFDINRIDGAAVPDWMMSAPSETMFAHDAERLARLRGAIDQIASRKPSTHARPRLRDRLFRFLNRKLEAIGQRPAPKAATTSGTAKANSAPDGKGKA